MITRHRRGASAVEFALTLPVLVAMFAGMIDYGWYFWREALILNALRESTRAGALQSPTSSENAGQCAACVTAATNAAKATLKNYGYDDLGITPTLERIPATGTPCTYAVRIDTSIPHERVFPLMPGPSTIDIDLVAMAQNMSCE